MDKRLHILQHLYGETKDDDERRRLLEDETVRDEYRAFSEVKVELDHRPRQRPRPDVLDAIVAAAASPERSSVRGRRDRAAVRTPRRRHTAFGMAGTALVVMCLLGIGLWQGLLRPEHAIVSEPVADRSAQDAAPSPAFEAEEEFERREDAAAPGPERPALEAERSPLAARSATSKAVAEPAAPPTPQEEPLPDLAWDDRDDVYQLHRRIEMIEARAEGTAWEEPAVPLEMLPSPGAAPFGHGLQQAGQRPRQ